MADTLTLNAGVGTLTGLVGGRLVTVTAQPASGGRVVGWDKVQELRSGAQRAGDGKAYVLTGIQHSVQVGAAALRIGAGRWSASPTPTTLGPRTATATPSFGHSTTLRLACPLTGSPAGCARCPR